MYMTDIYFVYEILYLYIIAASQTWESQDLPHY